MLRSSLLLTLSLVIISSVCASQETADADTNLIRDKRQGIRFGLEQSGPLGESTFVLNGQRIVRVTGIGSEFSTIPVNQTLRYQGGSVEFIDGLTGNPSSPQIPVDQLTVFTDFDGFNLQTFTGDAPGGISLPENLNGFFYNDRDGRAFYTNTLLVESQRPFPALFDPPIEISYEVRGARPDDSLVLNIDNTGAIPDGVADPEDDRIVLTGSTGTQLDSRQSFEYVSDFIIVRDGSAISGTIPGISELNVVDSAQAGNTFRQRLQTFSGNAGGTVFSGSGTLFTNGGQAFYTTLPDVQRDIGEQILNSQFKFSTSTSPTSAILQSNLGPSGGNDLIELVGATTTTYPRASTINYNGGTISVNDRNGNLLQEIGNAGNPIDLSTFFSHEVQQFSGGGTGSVNVPSGGLSLSYNSDTNSAFAYPSGAMLLTNSIQQALADVNAPPPPTASFSFQSDGLGGAVLFGQQQGEDSRELVSLTGSQTFDVSEDDLISYSGNSVQVSRFGTPIATYDNVDTFSANGQSNQLQTFIGEATQTYSGPGRLYTDSQGRGFFTSNPNLINGVEMFTSRLPPTTPNVVSRTVNGSSVVNIETTDGNTLVEVGSSTTTSIPGDQSLYYTNNELRTADSINIPAGARTFYDADNNRVSVSDSSDNVLFSSDAAQFFAYLTPGGGIDQLAVNTTLPSNGVLYTGPNGALYTINNDINGPISDALDTIGASSSIVNSDELTFYNGQTIQSFSGDAPTSFSGGGVVYTSGDQSFYSTVSGFNAGVPGRVSRLAPVSATYNTTTNRILVSSNAGDMIFMYSVGDSPFFQLGGSSMFTFTDENTITGLTREPLMGVNELRYYNGFETITFMTGNVTFDGPGVLVYNEEAGVAFFANDEITTSTISQRHTNVINTFQQPDIALGAGNVQSKFRDVDASFGQSVTVYEGADVNLQCFIRRSNPAPNFNFVVLDENNEYVQINETDLTDNYEIVRDPAGTSATLRILDIPRGTEPATFGCSASNLAGSDFARSIVTVRPPEAPEIVNNFFAFTPVRERYNPSGLILTASDLFPSREVIVADDRIDQSGLAPNPTLVNNLVHIGCKAEGRPKADIIWLENGAVINSSLPQFDIFEPREGRSVLTVNFTSFFEQGLPVSGMSTNFTCRATNAAAQVQGGVIVTPNEYVCTATGSSDEPCPVTCGFGLRTRGVSCSVNGLGLDSIQFEDVPTQLFTAPLELCQADQFCPFESFAYNEDEDFGDCSVTCGTGVERRNISCFITIDGVLTNETVDERYCEDLDLRRPDDFRLCSQDDCPFWVITGNFGPCSSTCRGGVRMRQVDCYQNFTDFSSETNFTFGIVNDSLCEELTMPAREQECNRLIPCPFRWHASRWFDECENNCQERNITCINFEPSDPSEVWPVNDSFCAELRPPHSVRSCGYGVCSRGDWLAGPFSECSVECGFGTYERAVYCTMRGTADTVVIEEGFCDVRFRPAEKQRCLVRNCPGRCDYEPEECRQIARLRLCKVPRFRERAEPCCKSCPAQATPIPLLVRTPPTLEAATLAPTEPPITMGTMATP